MRIDLDRILIHADGLVLDTDVGAIPIEGATMAEMARRLLRLPHTAAVETLPGALSTSDVPGNLTGATLSDAGQLLDLLASAGLMADRMGTESDLPRRDAMPKPRVAVTGSASWAVNLRASLAGAGISATVADDACDLMVIVADGDDPEAHRYYATAAQRRNVPVLHGSLERNEVILGPLFQAGRGACWNCARDRRIANDPHPHAAYRLNNHRRARPLVRKDAGLAGSLAADLLALEITRILNFGSKALIGRISVVSLTAPVAEVHLIIPLPECDICGGAGTIVDPRPYRLEFSAIGDAAAPMTDFPGWVDATCGVINAVWAEGPDEVGGLSFAIAQAANPPTITHPPSSGDPCWGKGLTRGNALRGAMGEALERYAARQVLHTRIVVAAVDELDGDVLTPEMLGLYADEQYARPDFPFERFDVRRRYHWILGEWLLDGGPVWLPAETTLFANHSFGDRLCQVTTSGLAMGCDRDDAAMRGALELVERDAAMMCWLGRRPSRRFSPDRSDPAVEAVMRFMEPFGAAVEFYLIDVGIPVPTVLTFGFGDGVRWPGLCVGSAAHVSPQAATRAAALEMVATGRGLLRARGTTIAGDAIHFHRFVDHAMHYFDPARSRAAAFLGSDALPICSASPGIVSENARELALLLADAGIRIALVDLTPPDVALSGLRVVRAVSDGLLPIHCGSGFERLGSRRFANIVSLNPDPHPFC
jgi:ribosomal protein S12 methylthiotransferase accessory factor